MPNWITKKKLFYDENGNDYELEVTPVKYCNDGYYRISENTREYYYLTEENILIDNNGKKHFKVIDIGEEEVALEITEAVA